jgi:hypothetical protein
MTISDLHLECRAEETKLHDRIEELEAELQTAHEIGARHAKRVGEQAMELQALREAAKKHLLEPSLATQQELWAALAKRLEGE